MSLQALSVRGPFHGHTGHDRHVREFVRELHNQGIAIQLTDLPNWHPGRLREEMRDPWFDSLNRDVGAKVVLHFCMPHQVERDRGKVHANYTMIEATRAPDSWIRLNRRHDAVIVPTESSRQAWLASGMPAEKLRVCPEGVNPAQFGVPAVPMDLPMADGGSVSRYRTRFLNVSELGPRKNVLGLLRVWMKATRPDDDAVLILKFSRDGPFTHLYQSLVMSVEEELGRTFADAAPLHVVDDIYADGDMPRLYAAATHYLSLSFGEGWDQPMVEAAASGLRLIAPEHSAYTTYLDSSIATMIPARPVPAQYWRLTATARLFEGADWWAPDEDRAVAAVRAEIEGRGEPKQSARDRVLANFTWKKSTAKLIGILDEAQAAKRKRWFL